MSFRWFQCCCRPVGRPGLILFIVIALGAGFAGCGEDADSPAGAEADDGAAPAQPPAPDPALLQKIEDSIVAAGDYLDVGRVEDAQTLVNWLLEHAADRWEVHELGGKIRMSLSFRAAQRGEESIAADLMMQAHKAYEQAVRRHDADGHLRMRAATVAYQVRKLDIALAHYTRGAELDPGNAQHPFFEAQILIERGQFRGAEERLNAALQLRPDEPHYLASLATVYMHQRRCEDAFVYAEKARELDPTNAELRIRHAFVLRRCGEPARAVDVLSGLSPRQRAGFGAAEELALALVDLERYLDAARTWEACFQQMHPLDTERWCPALGAAQCLLEAGEPEQAWEWYSHVAAIAPENSDIRKVKAAIEKALAERG